MVRIGQRFIQVTPRFFEYDMPIVDARSFSPLVDCFYEIEVSSIENRATSSKTQRTIRCCIRQSLVESLHRQDETTLLVRGATQWFDRNSSRAGSEIPSEFFAGLLPLQLEKIGSFWLVNGADYTTLFEFVNQWTSKRTPISDQIHQSSANTPFLQMVYRMCNWLIEVYDLAVARPLLEEEPSKGTLVFLRTVLHLWAMSVYEVFVPEVNYWLFQQQVAEHCPTLRIEYAMFENPQGQCKRFQGCLVPAQINRFLFRDHPFRSLIQLLHESEKNKRIYLDSTDKNEPEYSLHRWLAAYLGLLQLNCPIELYQSKLTSNSVPYVLRITFLTD